MQNPLAPSSAVPPLSGRTLVPRRMVLFCVLGVALGGLGGLVAQVLARLIGLLTNLAYYQRFDFEFVSPAQHTLGAWAVLVPIVGGIVVGIMARFGSKAIRGHGIPEAMEQVLTNRSQIPARLIWLKPLSAAIAIGTGGPFGAEGPIIATGGALGSVLGQILPTTADERKVLLACGAAAGMAATFGSPVAAVLLAVELLLFEFRARSLLPVALASVTATAVRIQVSGDVPAFTVPVLPSPDAMGIVMYAALGAIVGVAAVIVVRAVYDVEDAFEHVPVHWMWWPALGGAAVGLIGLIEPRTLGVGYDNIEHAIAGDFSSTVLAILVACKLASWLIALGSGTSGGTLAPIFTIGGGFGALLAVGVSHWLPEGALDPHMAALVGMAALFAASSRALMASVVFAFETTHQTSALVPLLCGCSVAYLVASLLQRNTIMTEKLVRRGTVVPADYSADPLEMLTVRQAATQAVRTLRASDSLEHVRQFLASGSADAGHQGYPVVDDAALLDGIVTRRDLISSENGATVVGAIAHRPVLVAFADSTLREAVDLMVQHDIGRLPVVERAQPRQVVGMLTRSDVLAAQRFHVHNALRRERTFTRRNRQTSATGVAGRPDPLPR